MKHIYLTILLILLSTTLSAHPIKMTVSKLYVETQKQELTYTINFFIDDFEPVLQEDYPHIPLNFQNPDENTTSAILQFMNHHVFIYVNEVRYTFEEINIQFPEENVCQVSTKIQQPGFAHISSISGSNTALFENYVTQSNMIRVGVDSHIKTYNLIKGKAQFKFIP